MERPLWIQRPFTLVVDVCHTEIEVTGEATFTLAAP